MTDIGHQSLKSDDVERGKQYIEIIQIKTVIAGALRLPKAVNLGETLSFIHHIIKQQSPSVVLCV
jgi:hypothetical protein